MLFIELFLIAVGLSMDAFAISIGKGLTMPKIEKKYAAVIALFFGGFQALMPFAGWLLGRQFEVYITNFDHWVAFVLLAVIGGKMIKEALAKEDEREELPFVLNLQELLLLAIATSIDALAVGVTFAFLGVDILSAVAVIGVVTYAFSFIGVYIGKLVGARNKKKAELFGGAVLVLMGLKILLEHLGFFA